MLHNMTIADRCLPKYLWRLLMIETWFEEFCSYLLLLIGKIKYNSRRHYQENQMTSEFLWNFSRILIRMPVADFSDKPTRKLWNPPGISIIIPFGNAAVGLFLGQPIRWPRNCKEIILLWLTNASGIRIGWRPSYYNLKFPAFSSSARQCKQTTLQGKTLML